MSDCLFCQLSQQEEEKLIYSTPTVAVIADIAPKAPTHLLLIPKEHIESINSCDEGHRQLLGDMLLIAGKLARERAIDDSGYRLVINTGYDAGQSVSHLHLHLIGGKKLPEMA